MRRRRCDQMYNASRTGTATRKNRLVGQRKLTGSDRHRGGHPAALLAQGGEAQDGADEVLFGGECEHVHRGARERAVELGLRLRTTASKRLRNFASWVSTWTLSPVSASFITTIPMSGSSRSRGSSSRTAITSCFRASMPSGRSHPGALKKSETRKITERRRIVRRACSMSSATDV